MTDLDRHVRQPGRDKLVKQVRAKINELGVEYIFFQFISVTGRVVGKGIPTDHWERTCEKGFQLVYGATANLFVDRHGDYIGYGPEAKELVGIPDPETFCQLPWDKKVARVFVTCFRNREERENPGAHLTSDCRGNLRIHAQEFKKKHGYQLRVGTEPEMMWLTKNEDGSPTGKGFSKPYCYHIDQFESLRPVFMKVFEYARAMGFDMIQGDHEDAPGQLELNWMYDDVLRNADRLSTYRQICAQVAREFNLIACFMTKPFMGVSASGCHTNMSLWKGGKDKVNKLSHKSLPAMDEVFTYVEGGTNTFMPDTKDVQLPGRQILTQERIIGMKQKKVAYGYAEEDVSMTFYVMNDYGIKEYFDEWQSRIIDFQTKEEIKNQLEKQFIPLVGESQRKSKERKIQILKKTGHVMGEIGVGTLQMIQMFSAKPAPKKKRKRKK